MARKITGETESTKDRILRQLDEANREKALRDKMTGGHLIDTIEDNYGKWSVGERMTGGHLIDTIEDNYGKWAVGERMTEGHLIDTIEDIYG